ncbi:MULTISPECIES: helix-turn-helix domain-containing protein, partial [unclassified Gordonia (in: high G+C Gram-positive bacteria)]|uniref:helix-turn-helix domain-containing protein n=1 Tax=unclassified Gordonia (in: high G+C Gram-positive bacteria) TaxID=2657482 RepID=UPI001966213C
MNSPTPRSPSRSAPIPAPRDEKPGRPPEPRVEQLIAEATSLFQDAGYRNVSVEEIGAAVGLTGPAVYRYFPSKQD